MNVNQTGEQSRVSKVDEFSPLWMFDRRADFDDAIVLNKDFAWSDYFSGLDVEEPCGVEDCHMLRSGWRRLGECRGDENAGKDGPQKGYNA